MFAACYCVATLVTGAWVFPVQDTLPPVRPPTAAALQRLVKTPITTIRADSFELLRAATIIGDDLLLVGVSGSNMHANIERFSLRTGRFVQRLTTQGRGPGEVSTPQFLHRMVGDSLFVYDDQQLRYTIFAPGTYRYARSGVVSAVRATSVSPLHSGQILVTTMMAGRAAVGFPIHLFQADGKRSSSFGGGGRTYLTRSDGDVSRVAAVANDGDIWAVTLRGPTVIEKYTREGQVQRVVSYGSGAELTSVAPPGPQVARTAIVSVDAGHVWILSLVADPNWRRGTVRSPGDERGGEIRVGSRPLLYDSILDVVDVRSGTIVARHRVDELITQILPGGYVILYGEAPDGSPVLRVERWSLRSQ